MILPKRFMQSVMEHFPEAVHMSARDRSDYGFAASDVCFALPATERSGIALLENGFFETWNLNGSHVTPSLAYALVRAASLVRESFFLPRENTFEGDTSERLAGTSRSIFRYKAATRLIADNRL